MLDSHDMPRALWLLGGDKQALRLSILCQMTMPGAPCVYYGDEIGLAAGGDPYCREAFPWQEVERWDRDLLEFYKSAIALRKAYPALQTGDLKLVHAAERTVAYQRKLGEQTLLVVFNAGLVQTQVNIPAEKMQDLATDTFANVWPPESDSIHKIQGNSLQLSLAPQSALVLVGVR
jgi:cyclomaltodextrinase / maltogenic alpha-amylase / neopullulanase